MNLSLGIILVLLWMVAGDGTISAEPSAPAPVVVTAGSREVRVFGVIYPRRFNAAEGDEAHYHLMVRQGGRSGSALIETPADDLAFHDALVTLGAQAGDNLSMAAWSERHDPRSAAPQEKVAGARLTMRISWKNNRPGISIDQAFRQPATRNPQPAIDWRFGGNRMRWFNQIPFVPRPGCLACLYSCPSGKVSNRALNIRDYVTSPGYFFANTEALPPDGTPVVVTFRLLP
jgi:hypothetical protein